MVSGCHLYYSAPPCRPKCAFADSGSKSIDQLVRSPKLSRAELAETSPKAREAMLAMAYALAFADEDLDANEQNRLKEYADGLGVSPRRSEELAGYAKAHIVDSLFEIIYLDGYADPSERAHVQRLASNLGLDSETVERIDIRCRKRKGIV